MENNEIMNFENIDMTDDVIMEGEGSGISTGGAMLIGAGLTLAIGAGIKLAKKGIAWLKARKEVHKPDHEVVVDDEDIERVATK